MNLKAVILIIFCLSARPFVASGSQPECENGPDGANSCGRGQFWNETVQACLVCPVNQYQDSINHRCPICKPCTPCKEGFVSADEGGCLPHQDTSCIKISDIDQVTDSISSTTEGFGHLTESSSTQLNQETQSLGQPEVTEISPLEHSVDGGGDLIIRGKNFRQDCQVTIVQFSQDKVPVWNGTCAVEAVFNHVSSLFAENTHILCEMPAYQTESLKDPVSVYAVLTCGEDYSSKLMEHPLTYIPVEASANDQKNEDSQTVIIILSVICCGLSIVIIGLVVCIVRQRRKRNYHLTSDSAGGNEKGQDSTDVQSDSRAGQNGTETELSNMLPESGPVQRG